MERQALWNVAGGMWTGISLMEGIVSHPSKIRVRVRTLCFHCWGPGFNPWSGNWDPTSRMAQPRNKKVSKTLTLGLKCVCVVPCILEHACVCFSQNWILNWQTFFFFWRYENTVLSRSVNTLYLLMHFLLLNLTCISGVHPCWDFLNTIGHGAFYWDTRVYLLSPFGNWLRG